MTARVPCDAIAADAVGLLALPEGAPERAEAEAHARGCGPCARALADARALLAMLDAAVLPAPSPAALARASRAVLAELDADERAAAGARAGAWRLALAVAAAVVAAWAVPLALATGPVAGGAPFAFSFGLAALAAVASVATVRWGGRVALAFPLLSAASALLVGTGRALGGLAGLHCSLVEALTAGGAGLGTWLAARALMKAAPRREVVLAAVGGGALAGHATLHLACPGATELPHVLVFHTGPVVLAVGLAFALAASAGRARAVRESSRP